MNNPPIGERNRLTKSLEKRIMLKMKLTLSLPLATIVDTVPVPLATKVDRTPSVPLATGIALFTNVRGWSLISLT